MNLNLLSTDEKREKYATYLDIKLKRLNWKNTRLNLIEISYHIALEKMLFPKD